MTTHTRYALVRIDYGCPRRARPEVAVLNVFDDAFGLHAHAARLNGPNTNVRYVVCPVVASLAPATLGHPAVAESYKAQQI